MPNDPFYDAFLERAKIHLIEARAHFDADEHLAWKDIPGNVPKVQTQVWIDALKAMVDHYKNIERHLS